MYTLEIGQSSIIVSVDNDIATVKCFPTDIEKQCNVDENGYNSPSELGMVLAQCISDAHRRKHSQELVTSVVTMEEHTLDKILTTFGFNK